MYRYINFTPEEWRENPDSRPKDQGIVVGCKTKGDDTIALVDTSDAHCMMIGAAGVGKTGYWLYPNLEYACAQGMSFMTTDIKGDLVRNYGKIAQNSYGYKISIIDLRNPMHSHGNNLPTWSTNIWIFMPPQESFSTRQKPRNILKSFQKPSLSRAWNRETLDRTAIFTMPQKDCCRLNSSCVRVL